MKSGKRSDKWSKIAKLRRRREEILRRFVDGLAGELRHDLADVRERILGVGYRDLRRRRPR